MIGTLRAFVVMTVWLWAIGGASAQETSTQAVVVELFTSQGCSSCPPADKMLTLLSERDDVIALALHVDYWDYIGWKDQFAQKAFTKRQRAYARMAGKRMVYTPQMVIGGTDHVIGTRPMEMTMALDKHRSRPAVVALRLVRDGGRLRIEADAAQAIGGELLVQVIRFLPRRQVEITRGENRGKTLTYSNIVTSWEEVGRWQTREALVLEVPSEGDGPLAVILQEPGPGPVIAAAQLR